MVQDYCLQLEKVFLVLKSDVKKIPYTMAAAQQPFDVTKPQPQLYVTPSFPHLMQVLEEFADTLSLTTRRK